MSIRKLVPLLLVVIASALLLQACSAAPAAPAQAPQAAEPTKAPAAAPTEAPAAAKTVKLGFSTMDKSNPYHAAVAIGVEERCKELGWDCTINDAKLDAAVQVAAIENFIASGAKYILVSPVDPASLEPLVKKAHEAGITWISIAQDVKGYDVFLSVPELAYGLEIGRNAGRWMKTNYTGPVEVGIIDYPELPQIIDRATGIEQGIKEFYPEAQFVARASAPDPEKGMKAAETIMQAHPNIKVIACINDGGCLGAAEAVKAMGKATPDFAVFGADATDEALAKIKEGGIYRGTVDIGPKKMGILAVDTVAKLAGGETLPSNQIPVEMTPITQEEKGAASQSVGKVKLGFSTMDKSNPYHAAVAIGVEERCKELGWDCTINDAKLDAAVQVAAIENFIASGAKYILVSPVDPASLEPLVKKAHEAGITWISIAQDVKGYDVFLSVPELAYGLEIGRNAGRWMKTNYTGPVEVGIIDYPELPQIIDRATGIEQGIKEFYPEAQFVARASAPDPEKGMKAAETIMQAHPNIKVIACINDGGCLGAAEAVKAMGKATPDFAVFGADATDEALAKIKEGGIYRGTVDIGPKKMGILAVDTVAKLAGGETLPSNQIPVEMTPITQE